METPNDCTGPLVPTARARVVPRLEEPANIPQPSAEVHVHLYRQAGEGTVWWEKPLRIAPWATRNPPPVRLGELIERDCQQRAKGEVRRWIRCWRCDRLITLTFAQAVRDYDEVIAEIDRFRQRWIRRLGAQGAPLLVPEPHPNGHGWHIHGATNRYVPKAILAELWPRGFVDIRRDKQPRGTMAPRKLSTYLAKYLTKELTAEQLAGVDPRPVGARRYFVPRGTSPAETRVVVATLKEAEVWLRKFYGEPDYIAPFQAREEVRIEGYWLSFPDRCLDPPPRPVKGA